MFKRRVGEVVSYFIDRKRPIIFDDGESTLRSLVDPTTGSGNSEFYMRSLTTVANSRTSFLQLFHIKILELNSLFTTMKVFISH